MSLHLSKSVPDRLNPLALLLIAAATLSTATSALGCRCRTSS
jgi:hypothetical protein